MLHAGPPRLGRTGAALAGITVAALAAASCTSSTTVSCPPGQTACGSSCRDLQTDPSHCGACNVSCYSGALCVSGTCTCPVGQEFCGNACVDVGTDPNHCGSCGRGCGLGTCAGGLCTCSAPPVELCPADPATGSCINTNTSTSNCGSCGYSCTAQAGSGFTCSIGTCGCLFTQCPTGGLPACVNTSTDPRNCGGCGLACPAGQVCASGRCGCTGGLTLCGSTCVNTGTSNANCGRCGNACPQGQSCSGGVCGSSCSGLTCGSLCCQGTACCAGQTCQVEHNNGVGNTFFDCIALPPPYTQQLATDAATAWAANGTSGPAVCPGCVVWQVTSACGVWCYAVGVSTAGTVNVNTVDNTCICPNPGSATWQ
ncbi:MAG TPA: hypothetical protein VMK42_20950 [Anaeromyxobacteraceae bacterium]|nr:hypothetical protein [Anaeromyxobacteraceae bacterium]